MGSYIYSSPARMARRSGNEDTVLAKHGFTLGAELGEGTYSKVKHCTWAKPGENTNKHIAIKIINKKTAPKDFLEKFLPRELDIIRNILHPNIVQTHEIITINQKVFIALEWAGRGDLLAYVRLKGAIKEPEAARFFSEMCQALDYLHGKDIVHRDLKCENILLSSQNLDSTEDMVDMEDIEDMEAMDITVARDLLMLRLSLDSMEDTVEDTMVDTVAMVAMEAMCITS